MLNVAVFYAMQENSDKEKILKYSIKDLEQISGIKAHTLRIWEQRYNIIKPLRSETNIRSYTNDDLRMLLNISILNNNGYKISKIADMSKEEIYNHVQQISSQQSETGTQIDNLIISMVEIDEDRFERAISNNILKIGFDRTINEIIYPFLQKVALMWMTGSINPAQEHFISSLIRQKLIASIDAQIVQPKPGTPRFMLYLPENELHDISLLYYHYTIRNFQLKSIYLGQSLPFEDLQKIYKVHQPEYLVSIITTAISSKSLNNYLNNLKSSFPFSTILLSGYQLVTQQPDLPENIKFFRDPSEFKAILNSLN